ncbi:hypothetical protein F4861DRAFT_386889 [Xylaria intraflava]|nr:hypothetical protein F4861DRAFT_386889 [Xylaria intraflava]
MTHKSTITGPGRRFQLPPRTEKRTPSSTMFTTTAKNLTSDIPFRWREEQVDIFEDWIDYKGANFSSGDLEPLLRALDLDGYGDIENYRGESVESLIIQKVRRKLMRTKSSYVERTEVPEEPSQPKAAATRASLPPIPAKSRDSGLAIPNAVVKVEEEVTTSRSNTASPPSYPSPNTQLRTPAPSPSPDYTRSTTRQPHKPSAKQQASSSTTKGTSSAKTAHGTIPARTSRAPLVTSADESLSASMEKVRQAMKELSLAISRLPVTMESIGLETAAYDAGLEIDHLDVLVREYTTN